MLVYILNHNGEPLMPCLPQKARKLLNENKAKVIKRTPFTLKLLHGSAGYKQPIIAGMDTGSKTIGCAAIANDQVLYQSEVVLRTDVSKKMQQRAMYRRTRRSRKCRYRKPRWLNRSSMRKNGRLAPSIKSKLNSHFREKKHVEKLLPITQWHIETASFDIHKIVNPLVNGKDYQQGSQKDYYNVKAFVLHRDNYKCQSKRNVKHSKKLHVHHIVFRSQGGSNAPGNLITLCETCHNDLHNKQFTLKAQPSKTKHATEIGIIKSIIKKSLNFKETFGYETKFKREQHLQLPKTHYYDAVAICCTENQRVKPLDTLFYKKHVAKGDYQQRKGSRSEKVIPVGKLFGLRKYDLIQTSKGTGFVKGKRSTGFFALETLNGEKIHNSVNVKKDTVRLQARSTTLIQQQTGEAIPPAFEKAGVLA